MANQFNAGSSMEIAWKISISFLKRLKEPPTIS
jgi:hypothetical protein